MRFQRWMVASIIALVVVMRAFSADVQKVSGVLKDFSYQVDHGAGTLEQLEIELADKALGQRVELTRRGNDYTAQLDFIRFSWKGAPEELALITQLEIPDLVLQLGGEGEHAITAGLINGIYNQNSFSLKELSMRCPHTSVGRVDNSMIDDCVNAAELKVKRLEFPAIKIFMEGIGHELGQLPREDLSQVVDDVALTVANGDYQAEVKTKLIFPVRLRVQGHIQLSENHKEITLRIDQARLGIVPVTSIVFSVLRNSLTSEQYRVDPPYVYIKLGE